MERAFKCLGCETIIVFMKSILNRGGGWNSYESSVEQARAKCPFCGEPELKEILDTEITVTV